jgi:hypothetical protein
MNANDSTAIQEARPVSPTFRGNRVVVVAPQTGSLLVGVLGLGLLLLSRLAT